MFNDWNKLDLDIRICNIGNWLQKSLLKFGRPVEKDTKSINGFVEIKLLIKFQLIANLDTWTHFSRHLKSSLLLKYQSWNYKNLFFALFSTMRTEQHS